MNVTGSVLRASYVGVALVCIAAGRLHVAAQELPANAILRGTVVDHLSGAPIDLAAVHLLGNDGRTLRTALTDSLGRFAFAVGERREFRISAERIGYRTMQSRTIALGAPPWQRRLIGQRVLRNPHGCTGGTKYFLNGGEIRLVSGMGLDMFLPRDLAGLEVHTAPQIPAEFGLMPPTGMTGAQPGQMVCKVIAVWLKR